MYARHVLSLRCQLTPSLPVFSLFCLLRGVSQIAPTVVAAQSISVIDFMAGPFTLYIEPCKPVGLVLFAVDADLNVAVVVQGSGS